MMLSAKSGGALTYMQKPSVFLLFILVAAGCAGPATVDETAAYHGAMSMRPSTADESAPTAGIRTRLDALRTNEFLPVIIRLQDKANVRSVVAIRDATDKNELRSATASYLQAYAAESQKDLMTEISALELRSLVKNVQPLWIANVICLESSRSAAEYLSRFEAVEYIAADTEAPLYLQDTAWGVQHINSPEVWRRAAGDITGRGVVVALLDSGADLQHPDLTNRLWINSAEDLDQDGRLTRSDINELDDDGNGYVDDVVGWDFEADDHDPSPDLFESGRAGGHGTHVAGIIAGDGSGGVTTGVAPGSSVMVLKIDSQRSAWAAMQYALTNGAQILNLSFGWPTSLSPDLATWRDAVDNMTDAGILVVTAAGSGGQAPMVHSPAPGDITTPGRVPRALTVGAVAPPKTRAWLDPMAKFSSTGPVSWQAVGGFSDYPFPPGLMKPDLTAPGVNIQSTMVGGSYAVKSGSSMAVAHVSGVAALLLEQEPDLLPHEIVSRLRESSWRFSDPNDVRGWGRVDALSAVNARTQSSDVDLAIDKPNRFWSTESIWFDNNGDGEQDRPIAGMTNRLFARIRNLGDRSVGNAEIRFYFADAGTLGNQSIRQEAPDKADRSPFEYIGSYFVPVVGPSGSLQDTVTGVVEWAAPEYSEDLGNWTIAVEVVTPNPPNKFDVNRENNTAISNHFQIDIVPGMVSAFSFYIYPDPEHPLEPFNLELMRNGLPDEFDVELSIEDFSMAQWAGTIRGFSPVQRVELAEFPADIAYSANNTLKLLGDRGQLQQIVLAGSRPVLARLIIRAPEADSDVYLESLSRLRGLTVNTVSDFGKFGGLALLFNIDEDAARLDNLIYAQK